MNIAILSCNTGGGHNSAAAAIARELDAQGHTYKIYSHQWTHSATHVSSTSTRSPSGVLPSGSFFFTMSPMMRLMSGT